MRRNELRTIKSAQPRKSLEQKILGVWEQIWVWCLMCILLRLPEVMRMDII